MSEIAHYEREFVERTRHILKKYRGEYKLSNAINCTLGLIVLPSEMVQRAQDPIWDISLADIKELSFLRIRMFEPIQSKRRGTIRYYDKTLGVFLKKIRNGLAHQNIEPVNSRHLFTGVKIRNYFTDNAGNSELDLEVELIREELEMFGLFIARKYLGE